MAGATKKKIVFIFLLRISIKYIFAKKKIFCIIPMKTIDKNVCYLLLYCQSCEMNRTNDAKYSNFRISLLFFFFFFPLEIQVRNVDVDPHWMLHVVIKLKQDACLSSWVQCFGVWVLGSMLFTGVQLVYVTRWTI